VNRLLKLYKNEKYILYVEQLGSEEPAFLVTFKVIYRWISVYKITRHHMNKCMLDFQEAATSMSVLRSLWHAHWLHKHQLKQDDGVVAWLEESLAALDGGFANFIEQMEGAGWDQSQIFLKVPKEPVLVLEHLDQ
jgi:hypothetical protein